MVTFSSSSIYNEWNSKCKLDLKTNRLTFNEIKLRIFFGPYADKSKHTMILNSLKSQ